MEREPTESDEGPARSSPDDFQSASTTPLSAIPLILANIVPLLGVMFWHWSLFSIMLIYWLENAIIGFYNIPKMLMIGGVLAVPMVLFFVIHYGIFMIVHLAFIFAIFGGLMSSPHRVQHFSIPVAFDGTTILAFISLFVSHGISFFSNFVGKEEYECSTIPKQMITPYGRIVIMHVTLILGGFFAMALGAPPLALAVMVLLKIGADLFSHVRERSIPGADAE